MPGESRTDRQRTPAQIRKGIGADSEARATDVQFWKTAKVVLPTPKEIVTMRLDADLLRWFRRERGYQTRVNAILRAYWKRTSQAKSLKESSEGKGLVCPPFAKCAKDGAPGFQNCFKMGVCPVSPQISSLS